MNSTESTNIDAYPNRTSTTTFSRVISAVRRKPLPSVRVSQARMGACKWGPYYDAVYYRIEVRGRHLANIALGRAARMYRSERKADAEAEESGRFLCQEIGRFRPSPSQLRDIVSALVARGDELYLPCVAGSTRRRA